jgi:hypothetical protein
MMLNLESASGPFICRAHLGQPLGAISGELTEIRKAALGDALPARVRGWRVMQVRRLGLDFRAERRASNTTLVIAYGRILYPRTDRVARPAFQPNTARCSSSGSMSTLSCLSCGDSVVDHDCVAMCSSGQPQQRGADRAVQLWKRAQQAETATGRPAVPPSTIRALRADSDRPTEMGESKKSRDHVGWRRAHYSFS